MIYQFREGSRFPVRPEVAGEALEAIGALNGGEVVPAAVVEAAEPDDSPIHRCFEWRNDRAAQLYREDQARALIRCLVRVEHVPGEPEPRPVIAYVHVTNSEGDPCYMSSARVVSDEQLRAQAIADAMALLNGVRRRYDHLSELQGVFEAIDRAAQQEAEQRARPKGRGRRPAARARA